MLPAGSPILDPAYLDDMRQWVGDDTVLTLLSSAPASFLAEMDAIRLAWNGGDSTGVQEGAHRLKGAAGAIGCRRLADHAQSLLKLSAAELAAPERLAALEADVETAIAATAQWRPPAPRR